MESAKEKVKDMGSVAKEHVEIYKAKIEEKAETAVLKTEEEKKIARELRKAKEHEAKKELHEAKARHAAEKLHAKQAHGYAAHNVPPVVGDEYADPMAGSQDNPLGHQPVGTAVPMSGTVVPTYPLGGYPPGHK